FAPQPNPVSPGRCRDRAQTESGSRFPLKRNAGEMPGSADTSDADGYRVGMRPQIGDQFAQTVRRQTLLADDQQQLTRDLRDRFEIHQQIEGEGVETADQGMRGQGPDTQGVAVTGRAHGPADADAAGRTGDVFNNDGLTQAGPEPLAKDPRQGIRSATR